MLDKTDYKILDILQEDGRIPLNELGKKIGITRQAATRRFNKIVKEGYIRKFNVDLDHSRLGRSIIAYVDIIFKHSFTYETEQMALDYIIKINGVRQINTTVGEKYLTVKIRAKNLNHLDDIIRSLQNDLPDTTIRTVIVNKLYFSNRKIKYSENLQ